MKNYYLLFLIVLVCGPVAAEDHIAGLLQDKEHRVVVPLQETRVFMDVNANLVETRVSQVFVNNSELNLEAVYTFPLPHGATVTDMAVTYSDRIIRSVVQEKKQAQKTYQTARSEGRKTALLEKDATNLFRTSLANFLPGERVEVSFSYIQQLPFNGRVYELTFPTTFGPRYQQQPTHPADATADGVDYQPVMNDGEAVEKHLVTMEAHVQGLLLYDIYSTTHPVFTEETSPGIHRVELAEQYVLPNKDITIRLELDQTEEPGVTFVQSAEQDSVHGLLTVFPPLDENYIPEAMPREVIFLIDTSGSMNGDPLYQAKEGLYECLSMLRSGDYFNLYRFSSDFSSFKETSQPAESLLLDEAGHWIDDLVSDGGTEMQRAMAHILGQPEIPGLMRMVVFLTDGDVGNQNSLMKMVDRKLGNARIFSFGVGSAPNEHLLRTLSESAYGVANFIKNDEDIGEVMSDFFATINAPVLTNLEVTWRDRSGNLNYKLDSYPKIAPDVFMNRPMQLCFRYDRFFDGTLEVRGFLGDQEVFYTYDVGQDQATSRPGIAKLYGQARVNDLMLSMMNARSQIEKDQIKEGIVETGIEYQLVTRFTSRVAVEQRIQKNAGQLPETILVPNMKKAGTDVKGGRRYAATATNDSLLLLIGVLVLLTGSSLLLRSRTRCAQASDL